MILPWWPVIVVDIVGSVLTLWIAMLCIWLAWDWAARNRNDIHRDYIFLLTAAFVVFAISRSVGHLARHLLVHSGHGAVWKTLAPFSGSINTAAFVAIFGFSIFFRRMHRAHRQLDRHTQRLEQLVAERTETLLDQLKFEQGLVDSIPAPIYFKDTEGTYLGCNNAFTEMFACKQDEITGKNIYDITLPEVADADIRSDKELLAKGGTKSFEAQIVTLDGETRDLAFYKALYRDQTTEVTLLIGTIFDVTMLKRLERQLQQTQKMEAIGTLAGGIAHDFNNILCAIIGYTDLALLQMDPDEPVRENLELVRRGGNRARLLVEQILTFSRPDKSERKPVRLVPIINDAIKLLRASLPSTVKVHQEIESGPLMIRADPTQIHQVLLNLCTNASHAMRENGGVLEIGISTVVHDDDDVSWRIDLPAGPYVRLSVSDTGHGIDPEIVPRVFDPFYTTKEIGEGSGMGLAVVHGIVKNHGGAVTVFSHPGKGTTFHVFFPAADGAEEELPVAPVLQPPMGTETILFVDDEFSIIDMGQRMLEYLGYTVAICNSGVEALDIVRKDPQQFDLVITDQTMPNMTGGELISHLLTLRADLPIILTTGYDKDINAEKAKTLGVAAFMMKPLTLLDLSVTLRQVLDENRSLEQSG